MLLYSSLHKIWGADVLFVPRFDLVPGYIEILGFIYMYIAVFSFYTFVDLVFLSHGCT